jgi:uncharacterized SAM-binding protein YcdF (DUF218 family)
MSARWRWRLFLWLAACGVLASLYFCRARLLPVAGGWLDVGERPRLADAIMLLNGDENGRPLAAAALVKGKWASRVLVTKTRLSPRAIQGLTLPEHEINRRVLLACGVPDRDIVLLEGPAESTYDEAAALAAYLQNTPNQRLMIVTSSPHTRRTRWVFSRILGDRVRQISIVSAPTDDYQMETWWWNRSGFESILGEYVKLVIYGVLYGWLGYLAAAVAGGGLLIRWLRHRRRSREAPAH